MITDVMQHQRFVLANAWSETRHRYAGTAMGAFWHVVQPLALIVLFSFIFAGVFPVRPGANSVSTSLIYIMGGMLPWLAFADCLIRCTTSLTDNANYLRKLPLPESVFVARTAASAGLMMMISLALAMVAASLLGAQPSWSWLTVPLAGVLMIGFAFGVGLILAPIHVMLKDTGQAVGVFTQFWMWLTPVIIAENLLPKALQTAQAFNPAYWFVRAVRQPLITGEAAPLYAWVIMITLVVSTVFVGTRMLRSMHSEIRDLL